VPPVTKATLSLSSVVMCELQTPIIVDEWLVVSDQGLTSG